MPRNPGAPFTSWPTKTKGPRRAWGTQSPKETTVRNAYCSPASSLRLQYPQRNSKLQHPYQDRCWLLPRSSHAGGARAWMTHPAGRSQAVPPSRKNPPRPNDASKRSRLAATAGQVDCSDYYSDGHAAIVAHGILFRQQDPLFQPSNVFSETNLKSNPSTTFLSSHMVSNPREVHFTRLPDQNIGS